MFLNTLVMCQEIMANDRLQSLTLIQSVSGTCFSSHFMYLLQEILMLCQCVQLWWTAKASSILLGGMADFHLPSKIFNLHALLSFFQYVYSQPFPSRWCRLVNVLPPRKLNTHRSWHALKLKYHEMKDGQAIQSETWGDATVAQVAKRWPLKNCPTFPFPNRTRLLNTCLI